MLLLSRETLTKEGGGVKILKMKIDVGRAGLRWMTLSLHPEDGEELLRIICSRGGSISSFIRSIVDAGVNYLQDVWERKERGEVPPKEVQSLQNCWDEAKKLEAGDTRIRLGVGLRQTQLIPLAGIAKAFGLSHSGAVRMILSWWQEGLLDPWLASQFKREPTPLPKLEELSKIGELVRVREGGEQ
jgi:hypothetical protein